MVSFFKDDEYEIVKSQRKKMIITIIILIVLFALSILALIFSYADLPYESDKGTSIKIISYIMTALYVPLIYITVGIRFKRIRKYYAMLNNLKTLTPVITEGVLKRTISDLETRDAVDLKTIVLSVYVERRQSNFDRYIYLPYEWEFPDIAIDTKVRFYTVENVLVGYDILDGENLEQKSENV